MGTNRDWRTNTGEASERFQPPPRPKDWIRRSIELGTESLTKVSGPAGAGKTALLEQWFRDLQDHGHHPAWLTLGVKETSPELLRQSILDATQGFSDTLAEGDRVLFIDQLDTVVTPTLDEVVRDLTLRPKPWRLVLAGRPELDPQLGWSDVDVRTIGFEQLRFSDSETRDLLLAGRPELSASRCQRLLERTDGWAFAASVASRLARVAGDSWASIESFSGRDRELCNYLDTEVLSGLSPSDEEFLLQISMLSRPTAELCGAVTGQRDSAERLHRLSKLNVMLTPASAGGFRWMVLPQEYLASRLERTNPDMLGAHRRRAQEWCVEQGRYAEAIEYAAANADVSAVAAITDAHGMDVLTSGRQQDVLRWLSELPASRSESDGWIGVVGATAHWITSGSDAAAEIEDWLNTAEFACVHAKAESEAEQSGPSIALINIARAAFLPLNPDDRYDLVRQALETDPDLDPSWQALANAVLGIAAYMNNQPRAARDALTKCLAIQASNGETPAWVTPMIAESVIATLSLIELDEGDRVRAEGLLYAAKLASTTTEPTGPMMIASSRLARHRGDKTEALNLAMEAAERSRSVEYRTVALIEAASLCHERGQVGASKDLTDRADDLIELAGASSRYVVKRRGIVVEQIKQRSDSSNKDGLTERELDVLRMLGTDLTRREIGEHLYIAHNTVKTYIRRLYAKLEVSSRPAAVAQAKEFGWL